MTNDEWVPPWEWERAVDPDLPPGVIEIRHDGRRVRFPLVEFMTSDDEHPPFF